MIDPKTLIVGNVITFGGAVNKTVVAVSTTGITFDTDDAIVPYTDSLWQIAVINNPLLPPLPSTLLGGNVTLNSGNYFFDATRSITPSMLLKACQDAATALLASGVTTA